MGMNNLSSLIENADDNALKAAEIWKIISFQ